MLTGNSTMAENGDIPSRLSTLQILIRAEELVKYRLKICAGNPVRQGDFPWEVLGVQGLQINNAVVRLYLRKRGLLVLLITLLDAVRGTLMGVQIFDMRH